MNVLNIMCKVKYMILVMLAVLASVVYADERRFVIQGEMSCDSLCYSKERINKLYLIHNANGREIVLDTAEVVNKCFTFEGVVPEELDIYNITGFDNGAIQVFLEEGNITIFSFDARYPISARVGGTACNDVMQKYVDANSRAIKAGSVRMNEMFDRIPADTPEGAAKRLVEQSSLFYSNNLYVKLAIMDFIYENIESPVVLYVIKYSLFPALTPTVIEQQFLRAIPSKLHSHHIYKELVNQVRAANLKVGSIAPDISGVTLEGEKLYLSDLQGKYVLLDFWASWCGPCRREFPFIKEALAYSEKSDNFVVLSYSIDSKDADWRKCIAGNALTHDNWIHISELKGWNTEAAKLFNVNAVPYTVLLNPKGEVVEFELRGELMLNKVKQIVDEAEAKK